jgi:hypothetical protein
MMVEITFGLNSRGGFSDGRSHSPIRFKGSSQQ